MFVCMQFLLSRLLIGCLYFFSILPLWILYRISDGLYLFLFYILQYRRKIVLTNLKNAFPKKDHKELTEISHRFYRHLCDQMIETIKALTISKRQIARRCTVLDPEILNKYARERRSVVAVLGHYGNWEWAALTAAVHFEQQMVVVYKPLINKAFDRMFRNMRTRFGVEVVPTANIARYYVRNKDEVFVNCLVADQSPSRIANAYWTTFLHQDTAFIQGPEKFARKYNHPVVYVSLQKVKRGRYQLHLSDLTDSPRELAPHKITSLHIQALEADIHRAPAYWLWSHRRWKRKRSSPNGSGKTAPIIHS